ncbi:MAG: hypothetical protein M1829_006443 [Trizodia sp. TS-e1964]|nr:MAG: hypothetical protein M1829_006443 [Trizodia sp. TS-e1964]
MKLTYLPLPLLLLVLPRLAAAAVVINPPPPVASPDANSPAAAKTAESPARSDIGTKDAPVDGWNGKPQQGPWARAGAQPVDTKKSVVVVADDDEVPLKPGKKKPVPKEPVKQPSTDNSPPPLSQPDSVMDDPKRELPKKGSTGTEGGVTEREKDRKAKEEKEGKEVERKPSPPQAAPPLPPSEEQKIKATQKTAASKEKDSKKKKEGGKEEDEKPVMEEIGKPKGAGGLEKPADLPDTPHDIPHPPPPSTGKVEDLDVSGVGTTTPTTANKNKNTDTSTADGVGIIQPLHSFILSLTMILFSEIGDKTFLIAALMAMKHDRLLVFSAAFAALIAMTVLSAVLGHAVPTLIPKRFTNIAASLLFLIFGLKLLREGLAMGPNEGVGEEMKEVELELEEKDYLSRKRRRRSSAISPYALEAGRRPRSNSNLPRIPRSPSTSRSRSPSPSAHSSSSSSAALRSALSGLHNLLSLLLSPAWMQTFIMTFLGEWGDRSQIATIAMAAGQDYWWVTGGAITGHACCTAVAVLGGRAIAGRVSLRVG